MSDPADNPSPIGKRHRTLQPLALLVYDYNEMVITAVSLPAHHIFQPWEAHDAWRGKRIPVTLGDAATEFDWGLNSGKGCFLPWNDFFSSCELAEELGLWDVTLEVSEMPQIERSGQGHNAGAMPGAPSSSRPAPPFFSDELLVKDSQGRTRLFYAAARGDQEAVEKMIFRFPGTGFYPQRMGFIESKDASGFSAVDAAEQNGHDELASFLRAQLWHMENYG